MAGYIYVFSNPAFPHLFKVGRTDDQATKSHRRGRPRKRPLKSTGHEVRDRAKQLSDSTSVPYSFCPEFYVEQPVSQDFERSVHADLAHGRYKENREFFNLRIEEILEVIQRKIKEPDAPFRVRIKSGTSLVRRSQMNDTWKVKRSKFWKEVEHLQRVNCSYYYPSADEDHFLAPDTKIENRIQEITAVVEKNRCHVFPHRFLECWANFLMFSPNGICFAFIQMSFPKTDRSHPEIPCVYNENPLNPVVRMCAALCKCEDEIYQQALTGTAPG